MTLSLVQDGVSVLETDQLAWLMSEGTIFRQVIFISPHVVFLYFCAPSWEFDHFFSIWSLDRTS